MVKSDRDPRELLSSLADPSRWGLAEVLRAGPMCVTELAEAVGLSQSCTTRHLQVLARCGLVERKRKGKRVLFRLRTEEVAVAGLLAWVETDGRAAPGAADPHIRASAATPEPKRAKKQGSARDRSPADSGPTETTPPRRPPRRGDLEDYLL